MSAVLALAGMIAWPSIAKGGVEIWPTEGRGVYRLGLAQTAGGQRLVIGSTYDNRLCCWDENGKHRWDAALGGFVFDLCCADLNGDGAEEILTAGADGAIGCFSVAGKELWKHILPAPVLQVTVARLDGKSPVVLAGGVSRQIVMLSPTAQLTRTVDMEGELGGVAVRVLRAGDFDGDGRDEVALLGLRGRTLETRFLKGAELKPLPGASENSGIRAPNGLAADVNGDGAAELLLDDGVYSLKGKNTGTARRIAALPEELRAASYDYNYRMRSLAVGDLIDGGGTEIVTLDGPDLQLCASDGKALGSAHAPLSFTDVLCLPGSPHGSILLGSGTGGDDNLYRVTFDSGWEKALESLPRAGRMKAIEENLGRVAKASANWQGQPMDGAGGPFDVVVAHHMWQAKTSLESVDGWIEEVRFFEKSFPYPRLRFSICFWPGEQLPLLRPDGKEWPHDKRLGHNLTREQIAAAARKFEQAGCRFWVQVGHGCSPHLSVEAVKAILDAAPKTCLGFVSAEDEQLDEMTYYFEHHVKPILELCLARGKRFIPRNKTVWWCSQPADPEMRRLIFDGRYRSVLLPCVEDSNSRTADAQLAARVGLWLDGQVDDWASRCSADWFSFNRAWEWEAVMTGHPHLRYFTSQALLGARVFMMLTGDRERESGDWTRVGSEGIAPFLHMLGRGLITPPTREQMKSISSVVLNVQGRAERFVSHGANGHGFQLWNADGTESKPWAFDRLDCYWGMAPLPQTDVSTYLWGRTRRSAQHLPVTAPHGFVCMVPGPVPRKDGPWSTVWTTNGDSLAKDGETYPLEKARTMILADLAEGEKRQPVHIEGHLLHQVIQQGSARYIVALIDPGWVDPDERSANLSVRESGNWIVTDRISGQPLGPAGAGIHIMVPAGTLRILDLTRKD